MARLTQLWPTGTAGRAYDWLAGFGRPPASVGGPYCVAAGQMFLAAAAGGGTFIAGAARRETYLAGPAAGELER